MLIKKKGISPPELTEKKLKEYIQDRMLFRKEQFCLEPTIDFPQGALFGDVCEDWQINYIFKPIDERDENGFPKYKLLYYQLPKKALSIETPIITPNGWKLLKDIKEGDFIFNEKGEITKVLYSTNVMYNHKCYEVVFSDNTSIIADEGHLWTVLNLKIQNSLRDFDRYHNKTSNNPWPENWWGGEIKNKNGVKSIEAEILTTEELSKNIKKGTKYNYSIPTCKELYYNFKSLLIDPWCLGYLLGDGDSQGYGSIACNPKDKEFLKKQFQQRGFPLSKYEDQDKYHFRINNISANWKKLNLYKNKHIPNEYLCSNSKQRLDIIKGLFDSDGCYDDSKDFYIFTNTNKELIYNLLQLLRSLGLVPKLNIQSNIHLNNVKCKNKYIIYVKSKIPLFTLPRQLNKILNTSKKYYYKHNTSRKIKSIKEVPSIPVKCIRVDSPSNLFLAGEGMVPTHNSGKTVLMAGEAIVQLLLSPRPTEENYILAGDKLQASYVLAKMKDFIARNPNFVDLFTIYKNEIIVPSTGAMIQVMSSEASSKQGRNPDLFVFDELWNQPNRDLWDAMFLGMAAKPYAQGIVLTNAGFDMKSICYEVRELCKSGEFKNFYWFEPTGALLESLKMPWIVDTWLEIERKSMPPKVFKRFRQNLWVAEGENPFMPDEGWECFKPYLTEKFLCYKDAHFVGIDLGLKKDAASLTVLHREGKKLVADMFRRWLGSSENPVKISEIETELILILRNFNNCVLVCDPWQMMGTIQRFRSAGVEVIEFYLTTENIGKLSRNLFYLFKNQSIDLPDYGKLKDELKGLQVVEKSYGWRIDHSGDTTSDITMGLGMAAVVAMEKGIDSYSGKDLADLGFLDASSIYKAGGNKRDFSETIIIQNNNSENNNSKKENESAIKIYKFQKRLF